jgi:hypothetical protein
VFNTLDGALAIHCEFDPLLQFDGLFLGELVAVAGGRLAQTGEVVDAAVVLEGPDIVVRVPGSFTERSMPL